MSKPNVKSNGSLTHRDEVYLRLNCLKFVIEGGSNMDRSKPQEKAQEYIDFVMGKKVKVTKKPVPTFIEKPKKPVDTVSTMVIPADRKETGLPSKILS